MRRTSFRLLLLASVALLSSIAHSRPARADETVLNFATTNIPTTRLNIQYLHPWAEAINADAKGAVRIEIRDGTTIANFVARGDKRTIIDLTPEQTAAWQKKLEPLTDSWVRNTPDGEKVLTAYRAELAKIEAEQ
jgi:hypothetical protein